MATNKASKKNAVETLSESVAPGAISPANVQVTFMSGVGKVTAFLIRQGVLINMQSIDASGNILFSDVRTDDAISVNGICTGSATVAVDRDTSPATPVQFSAGPIHVGLIVN
jgi:hypothetical protein